MNIGVIVTGDAEVVRHLRDSAADRPIHNFLDAGGMLLVNELKSHARVNTGTGRRSMHHEVRHREVIAGTNLLYMQVMARGRKPGSPMPPKGVLLGWMRSKGIPDNREFLIRRAIGRHGIKGDDFDVKAMAAALPGIRGLLPVLARDIVAEIVGG